MEPALVASDSNWSSFAFEGIMSTEESEFMSQLLSNYPFANEQNFDQNVSIPASFSYEASSLMYGEGESLHYTNNNIGLESLDPNMLFSWPHGSNTSLVNAPDHVNYTLMDLCPVEEPNASSVDLFMSNEDMCSHHIGESGLNSSEEVAVSNQICSPKRKLQTPEADDTLIDKSATNQVESPKKKPKVSGRAQRSSKNGKAKKNQKPVQICEEGDNVMYLNRQSSSSYSSEDDSNASEEANGGPAALNPNGKTRASRGSATDPQSLYARKRRERINERLRILQNLVPNGTKVDISTMLEEAVQYVKFLQLQIKLLSSDDLWMYAPIAYNGMGIGLDLNISPR